MRAALLVFREMAHRRFQFAAGLVCVAVAVCCGVSAVLLLRAFDERSEQLQDAQARQKEAIVLRHKGRIEARQEQSRKAWKDYQDDVRKNMLNLGFNLMILHKDQNLSVPDVHGQADGDKGHYLPESSADTLAQAKLIDINHLLPFLQMKYYWAEKKRWVTLWGTTGEVWMQDPNSQKPMVRPVRPGTVVLGAAIHQSLGLKTGDRIELGGRGFTVAACYDRQSFEVDERVSMALADAQKILGKSGQITGMLAIDCMCNPEGLAGIDRKIKELLPDTRVIDYRGNALVRSQSREAAAKAAKDNLDRARQDRKDALEAHEASAARDRAARLDMRAKRSAFGTLAVAMAGAFAAVILGVLAWENVRRRRGEIALLRAIGVSRGTVLRLVLAKALLTALPGALAGYAGGLAVGLTQDYAGPIDPLLPTLSLAGAAVLSLLATWLPARAAANVDPALALAKEAA